MKATFHIVAVPPDELGSVWPFASASILRGLDTARMDIAETMARVKRKNLVLWLITQVAPARIVATFLTEIVEDEGKWKVVVCGLAGEEPIMWLSQLDGEMKRFAHLEGCTRIAFCGRPAWARLLRGYDVVGEMEPGVAIMEGAVA